MKPPKNYAYQFKGYELSDNPKDREWEKHHRNRWPIAAGTLSKYPSANPLDALRNSRGTILNIVEVAYDRPSEIKIPRVLLCDRQRVVESFDAGEMLDYYARMEALSAVHLWDAPESVIDFLMTGDADARASAWVQADKKLCHLDETNGSPVLICAVGAAHSAASGLSADFRAAAAFFGTRYIPKSKKTNDARKDFNSLVWENLAPLLK